MKCRQCDKPLVGYQRFFCSNYCSAASRKHTLTITCKLCGREKTGQYSKIIIRKYCSPECGGLAMRGTKRTPEQVANLQASHRVRAAGEKMRHKNRRAENRLTVIREYVLELRHANRAEQR